MADYAIHDTTLEAIADTIRKKDGSSALIDPADYAERINLMGMLEEKTVSGSVVAFSDGADDVPLKSCAVTIAPTLDGVSSVDVVHGGKNLLNDSIRGKNGANIFFAHNTGSQTDFALRLKKGTYTFSVVTADGTTTNLCVKNSDTNTNITGFPAYNSLSKTFTLSEDTNCAVYVYKSGYTDVTDILTAQIEVGSSATAYEPFVQPTTYTASLGRTIYGGEVDIVKGVGSEQGYKVVVDGTNLYFAKAGNYYNSYPRTLPTLGNPWKLAQSDEISFGYNSNYGGFIFLTVARAEEFGLYSAEEVNAYFAQNPTTIILNLATPTDFTFDGQEIPTRLGVNNFWSDSGDTEVTYRSSGTVTPVLPTLINKTITENGTYSAEDDGADGYDEVTVNVSGGGGNTPEATQTLICDNSSLGSTLTFTDDYENYDLIKFVVYRSDVQNTFVFYATPAMIDACWQYSSNRINFNQPYGNNFVCYQKSSNTSWSRYGVRNMAVQYVYGLTFTNCTVAETELYNRQGIGSSAVTFTPPTGESFLDYDYILFMTCTGNSDETQVNLEVFQPDIEKDIFGSDNVKENTVTVYRYNTGGTTATVTENTITSYQYFYASGLKLNFNQQSLLGGSLGSSNSEEENTNSEQEEVENEPD